MKNRFDAVGGDGVPPHPARLHEGSQQLTPKHVEVNSAERHSGRIAEGGASLGGTLTLEANQSIASRVPGWLRVDNIRATGEEELRNCRNLIVTEKIDNVTVQALRFCTHVQALHFEGEYSLTDFCALPELDSLVELSVEDAPHLENFKGVSKFSGLKTLQVARAPFKEVCLHAIGVGCGLVKLCLDSCDYLKDLSPLGEVETLEYLAVCKCVGVVSGVGSLGKLPVLRELCLVGASINGESLQGLGDTTSIQKLHIVSCGCLEDVSPIAEMVTLSHLVIETCTAIEKGVGELGGLPLLCGLDLSYSSVADDWLHGLSCSRCLVDLKLASCDELSDVSAISRIETLAVLDLQSCDTLEDGIGELGKLPQLKDLNLSCTRIDNDALVNLCASCSLVRLNISSCDRLTNLSPLANVKTLEELSIDACIEVQEGIADIGELPALRKLDAACLPITNSSLMALSRSRSLVALCLDTCMDITDVSCLGMTKTLEEVSLNTCLSITKGIDKLKDLPRLRSLNLRRVSAEDEVIADLREKGVNLLR